MIIDTQGNYCEPESSVNGPESLFGQNWQILSCWYLWYLERVQKSLCSGCTQRKTPTKYPAPPQLQLSFFPSPAFRCMQGRSPSTLITEPTQRTSCPSKKTLSVFALDSTVQLFHTTTGQHYPCRHLHLISRFSQTLSTGRMIV